MQALFWWCLVANLCAIPAPLVHTHTHGPTVMLRRQNLVRERSLTRGAVACVGGDIQSQGPVTVVNSTFEDSEAVTYGGSIQITSGTAVPVEIINSTFTRCTCAGTLAATCPAHGERLTEPSGCSVP